MQFGKYFRRLGLAYDAVLSSGSGKILGTLTAFLGLLAGFFGALPANSAFGSAALIILLTAGLVAIFFLAYCVFQFIIIAKMPVGMETTIPPTGYHCRVLDTYQDAKLLNEKIVPVLFADSSPPVEAALAAQEKNNRRLVAIIHKKSEQIAGWASAWPVKMQSARDLESGKRSDDSLTIDDLLDRRMNNKARCVVILAFGILPEFQKLPDQLFAKLSSYLLWHIHDEFIYSKDRKVRLIAVAYSDEGRRMCEMLGMKPNGCFTRYANGSDPKPVYTIDATQLDLRKHLKSSFL